MAYNKQNDLIMKKNKGTILEEVEDFKYLGAWVAEPRKDIKVNKALAWHALNSMTSVWKSKMPEYLKLRFFRSATVESVLLYGYEAWTMDAKAEKQIDGCYT